MTEIVDCPSCAAEVEVDTDDPNYPDVPCPCCETTIQVITDETEERGRRGGRPLV